MSWRISEEEFLVSGRSYPIYLSLSTNRVALPDGTFINAANEYFRVSAEGVILEWYTGPFTSTLEECLYVIDIYCVLQLSLYKIDWTECYGRPPARQKQVCIQDLAPILEDMLPFNPVRVIQEFHQRRAQDSKGNE